MAKLPKYFSTLAFGAIGTLAIAAPASAGSFNGVSLSWAFECFNDSMTQKLDQTVETSTWYYTQDATGDDSGGNRYELYGSAFLETEDDVYFVINTHKMNLHDGDKKILKWRDFSGEAPEDALNTRTVNKWLNIDTALVPEDVQGMSSRDAQAQGYKPKMGWKNAIDAGIEVPANVEELSDWRQRNGKWQKRVITRWQQRTPVTQYQYDTGSYEIGWGDLLIDASGLGLGGNNGDLFGIHFGGNQGGVEEFGLYKNVTAAAIGGERRGYGSIVDDGDRSTYDYDPRFIQRQVDKNRLSSEANLYGDISRADGAAFYDKPYNVIDSGDYVASIDMVDMEELMLKGFEKETFQGNRTVAFKIAKSHFGLEEPQSVPEPTGALGLVGVGGLLVRRRRKA
ncbi:MAG: PEP-CTERM sorting domain-containing protein [Geitlerinemataceae cyanobacterium]|mgnify:CR=1 FL=1